MPCDQREIETGRLKAQNRCPNVWPTVVCSRSEPTRIEKVARDLGILHRSYIYGSCGDRPDHDRGPDKGAVTRRGALNRREMSARRRRQP